MYINKLTIATLSIVFLLVCSVILIGANHQPQIEWEHIIYIMKVDTYESYHTVYTPVNEVGVRFWMKDTGQFKKGDWSVSGGDFSELGKENKGSGNNYDKFPLFFYALNQRLNLEQIGIETQRMDLAVMNCLGRAGYELIYRHTGRSEYEGITESFTFKRRKL